MFEALGRFIVWYLKIFFYCVCALCVFGLMVAAWEFVTTWKLPKDFGVVLILCIGVPLLMLGSWRGRKIIGFVLGGLGIAFIGAVLITALTGKGKK